MARVRRERSGTSSQASARFLERRKAVLGGVGVEFAEFGQFTDIGFKRRLGEIALIFEGRRSDFELHYRLVAVMDLSETAWNKHKPLLMLLVPLAGNSGGFHAGFGGFFAVTQNEIVILQRLVKASLEGLGAVVHSRCGGVGSLVGAIRN